MKALNFLFLSAGLFISLSCTPLSLDGKPRDRDRNRDPARGALRYEDTSQREPISLDELRQKTEASKKNCYQYTNCRDFSILGKLSPNKPFLRCICKMIDEGLKPTCEEERVAKNALKYYKDKGDEEKEREMEEYLEIIEDIKYDLEERIYDHADRSDDIHGRTQDAIDEEWDSLKHPNSVWNQLLKHGTEMLVDDQIGGVTRAIEAKARLACRGQIDWDKFKAKRR